MANTGNVIIVFLLYTAAMFILPLVTYFAVHKILEDDFNITGFPNRAWSLTCAVIVVNLIIISYVWRAYKHDIVNARPSNEHLEMTLSENLDLKKIKKPRYVRVNTLHHTPDEVIKFFRNSGWNFLLPPYDYNEFLKLISNLPEKTFTRDIHIKELLVFPGNSQFYETEFYQNGIILLQDKASCFPAFLLKPKTNSVVLDMCAAPGMKTTHLSAIMRNTGKIYAAEIKANRYQVLCDLVNKASCKNVLPICEDALMLNPDNQDQNWCNDVEYILVDPSCTGSGIVERRNIFDDEKQDFKRLKKLCGFQYKLLLHALTNFPKAKRVVYSTCSVHSAENEKIVADVLTKLKNLQSIKNNEGQKNTDQSFRLVKPLEDTWPRRGSTNFEEGDMCIFSDPKHDLTNGFFIAVFER